VSRWPPAFHFLHLESSLATSEYVINQLTFFRLCSSGIHKPLRLRNTTRCVAVTSSNEQWTAEAMKAPSKAGRARKQNVRMTFRVGTTEDTEFLRSYVILRPKKIRFAAPFVMSKQQCHMQRERPLNIL